MPAGFYKILYPSPLRPAQQPNSIPLFELPDATMEEENGNEVHGKLKF